MSGRPGDNRCYSSSLTLNQALLIIVMALIVLE